MYFQAAIDYSNRQAVKVTFSSSQRARVFSVSSMNVKMMQKGGGDFYGL